MKRSEIISNLAKKLSREYEDNGYVDECDYKTAEMILNYIEVVGMLPPRTKLSHLDAYDNAWDPETVSK